MFSEQDKAQMQQRGSKESTVLEQIENFKNGFPFVNLVRAATIGDGILKLDDSNVSGYVEKYESVLPSKRVVKFVPASGAASRMFKALFGFMDSYDGSADSQKEFEESDKLKPLRAFFSDIEKFAFYNDLKAAATSDGYDFEEGLKNKEYHKILAYLLTDKGLNYGGLPKGLLKFHSYGKNERTPVEEHLVEGAVYGKDANNNVNLHFTVSPEHDALFSAKVKEVLADYEDEYGVRYNISFSNQKASTDTIAVDMENQPFRNSDDSILFRPAGHGALLENLDEIEADIIFIKNIDNVVPDRIKDETYRYKKALAGVLVEFQEKAFDYVARLKSDKENESLVEETCEFGVNKLGVDIPSHFDTLDIVTKSNMLIKKLNKPIRVCGMVKNEGEPGGGPFWVKDAENTTALQIVESAQIDMENTAQADIVKGATHFNPVDLVCAVKDGTKAKFNLLEYRDSKTGFITEKSKDGKDLKAQELPGLWNGAMAYWNTIFVEVPIITFNPVKTVNDLLRDQHQG